MRTRRSLLMLVSDGILRVYMVSLVWPHTDSQPSIYYTARLL